MQYVDHVPRGALHTSVPWLGLRAPAAAASDLLLQSANRGEQRQRRCIRGLDNYRAVRHGFGVKHSLAMTVERQTTGLCASLRRPAAPAQDRRAA